MTSNPANEHLHLVRHAAQQQTNDYRPFVYAHVSSYDPALHRLRSLVPSLRDEGGTPVLTPWKPLLSPWGGAGWGFQGAPVGGATYQNPTAGEQTKLSIVERNRGAAVSDGFTFNSVTPPPFPSQKPGELGIKHRSGTFLYLHDDGSVEVTGRGGSTVTIDGNGNVTVSAAGNNGTVTIVAAGHVDVRTPELRCTGKVIANYGTGASVSLTTHDHGGVQTGGGITGAPVAGS